MALITDASCIISLAFPDENSLYAHAVIDVISADRAFVPTIFWFELRNALLMGERRKRCTADQTALFLGTLDLLPFEIDQQPREASVLSLARRHVLTVYDAAYLELAQRKNLPLATIDNALIKAAKSIGVAVWRSE